MLAGAGSGSYRRSVCAVTRLRRAVVLIVFVIASLVFALVTAVARLRSKIEAKGLTWANAKEDRRRTPREGLRRQ
jgi:hypothetical protein